VSAIRTEVYEDRGISHLAWESQKSSAPRLDFSQASFDSIVVLSPAHPNAMQQSEY